MKLHRLSFKNINSLAGEWHIDFTAPEYRDGIFLIVGDTGSGKTSVLDALSLALYGRTARQGKLSAQVNEVMTRGTGECWAEATFSCGEGSFTARWSQKRSHRRPGGELGGCEIQLWREPSREEIGQHRNADTKRRIAELVGLDFDQFQRTVMLSQGQFDRFLTAKPNERSAILEQATGTEIYARAGRVIHDRWKRAKADAMLAIERRNALSVLPDAERAALQAELDAALAAVPGVQAQLAAAQSECQWHARASELDARKATLDAEAAALAERDDALAEPRRLLAIARSARALDPLHAALETARRNAETAAAEAARRTTANAGAAQKLAAANAALRNAEATLLAASDSLAQRLPAIARARELDTELAAAAITLAAAKKDLRAAEDAREEASGRRTTLEAAIAASSALAGWLGAVLSANTPSMPPPPAGIPSALADAAGRLDKARATHRRAREKLAPADAAREAAARAADAAAQALAARRPDLESAISAAEDAWRLALRIRSLDEHRAALADGEPCPLCGATSHPYSAGQLPQPDSCKARLDSLRADLATLQSAATDTADAARKADRAAVRAREALDVARADLDELSASLADARARVVAEADKDASSLAGLRADAGRLESAVAAASAAHRAAAGRVEELRAQRAATGVGDSPDEEQARLRRALDTATESASRARAAVATAAATAVAAAAEHAAADTARTEAEAAVSAAAGAFLAAAEAAGFPDESVWARARSTDNAVRRTEEAEAALAAARERHAGALSALAADRATHAAAAPASPRGPGEAAAGRDTLQSRLDDLQQTVGKTRERLSSDNANRAEAARRAETADRARLEEIRWDNLNTWLGQADGAAFRAYAQGITLRLLLERANPRLAAMTSGRYQMVWPPDSTDLLPRMVDRHQANAVRPVSNLSGGERFQVSLALALGLSDMTSRTLRSGTLFLDEGFGTLDERALDTALDTLERLREDGKSIGVISHVKELADRFGTQIRVRKTGGTGRLEGPGVTSGPL